MPVYFSFTKFSLPLILTFVVSVAVTLLIRDGYYFWGLAILGIGIPIVFVSFGLWRWAVKKVRDR